MGIVCFTAPNQWFQLFTGFSVLKSFSGISKDLCTFHKSCARFIEAVHVS